MLPKVVRTEGSREHRDIARESTQFDANSGSEMVDHSPKGKPIVGKGQTPAPRFAQEMASQVPPWIDCRPVHPLVPTQSVGTRSNGNTPRAGNVESSVDELLRNDSDAAGTADANRPTKDESDSIFPFVRHAQADRGGGEVDLADLHLRYLQAGALFQVRDQLVTAIRRK